MRSLALATLLAVTAAASAQAQTSNDVRISGTVEKFDKGLISISPSTGITLVVHFDPGPGINSMRKAKPSDIKAGEQVSVQAKPNPAGGLMASQVIIYEQGAEQRAGTEASTDPSQVVARVTDVAASPDGPMLSLAFKEGERKITLGKEAVIWTARPASPDDIKPGSLITIAGTKAPEGEVTMVKASIGPAGSGNPPL